MSHSFEAKSVSGADAKKSAIAAESTCSEKELTPRKDWVRTLK